MEQYPQQPQNAEFQPESQPSPIPPAQAVPETMPQPAPMPPAQTASAAVAQPASIPMPATQPAPGGYISAPWTGAQKAGWFFVGFFGGIVGIIVASLCNVTHPYRSDATKMAVIGCVVTLVLSILVVFVGIGSLVSLMTLLDM